MEQREKELLLKRIICGYTRLKLNEETIIIRPPSKDIEYESCEIYNDAYNKAESLGIMTDNDAKNYLISIGVWSDKKQNELDKILPDHIDYWKVQVYNSYFQSNTKERNRKYLKVAQHELSSLLNQRYKLEAYTCNGIASFSKNMFILTNSVFIKDKLLDFSQYNINDIMNLYHSNIIGQQTLRMLARDNTWNSLYSSYKKSGTKIFDNNPLSLEQIGLVQWTSLYDSINDSPECPPEDIVEDDDALDGWLIIQRKNRDNGRKQSVLDKDVKDSNADEVFLVAETKEDIERIRNLNDAQGMSIINSRLKQVQEKGVVKDIDFTDVQNQLMMDAVQQTKDIYKSRR